MQWPEEKLNGACAEGPMVAVRSDAVKESRGGGATRFGCHGLLPVFRYATRTRDSALAEPVAHRTKRTTLFSSSLSRFPLRKQEILCAE